MQVIGTALFNGMIVFCCPITSHYALRASPNSRSFQSAFKEIFRHKTNKKGSKVRQATQSAHLKNARIYKQPIMFYFFVLVSAVLAFFLSLPVERLSFFSFFLLG